ncbi:cysteine peptidase family C39 domain-containing protein [Candidatus Hydrogenedentota bacterium]
MEILSIILIACLCIGALWVGSHTWRMGRRVLYIVLVASVAFISFYIICQLFPWVSLTFFPWTNYAYFEQVWLFPMAILVLACAVGRLDNVRETRAVKILIAFLCFGTCMMQASPLINRIRMGEFLEDFDDPGLVYQSSNWSCAPASIASLLRMKGIHAAEQEMAVLSLTKPLIGTTPRGACLGLERKAGKLGWHARIVKRDYDELMELEPPFLTSYMLGGRIAHMVVATGVYEDYFHMFNPLGGHEMQKRDEFESNHLGYAILFEKTE